MDYMYDVVIIGAGVSGSASASELSRYKVNACVIEKTEDVCSGTSKAVSYTHLWKRYKEKGKIL